jgi:LPS sulfotransferase NodH
MSATSGAPLALPAISCLIATTPWSGTAPLCQELRATGLAGYPRDYFNPLEVVQRSREWHLLHTAKDFAARYMNAVSKSARGPNGALSVNLPWSHQRWLVRFARAASPDDTATAVRTDAAVLETWYPQTRYLYLTSSDKARQAARWYLGRTGSAAAVGGAPRPGQPSDFQEVRWIEALIARQERAWEIYFRMHEIEAHRIEYEAFQAHPEETVAEILGWLGLSGAPDRARNGKGRPQRPAKPIDWLPDYLAQRDRLSTTIGVRQGQG